MDMNIWIVVLMVLAGGALGGIVNALITDNSFVLPKKDETDGIWRAGIIGNIVVSAIAGLLSWGSADPIAGVVIASIIEVEVPTRTEQGVGLTMGALMTAVFVGIAGARWLTSAIDKRVLQTQKATIEAKDAELNKLRPSTV